MQIDDPSVIAEVTSAFERYEAALMADDIAVMDELFHQAPSTVRYGVGEVLYGYDEIAAFRRSRGGSPQRRLGRVAIHSFGEHHATTHAEFFRDGSEKRGRQTQSWAKIDGVWKVVSAHVSIEGQTS
ncbi:MAG: oxalurate catabolism protein HpxZ [Pseudomonadota bacterium]